MPKAEKGTPKDIAKRIKAKGLQKLKFYCQLCQKQCRDANGFKCHLTSESHLRQMKLFSENAAGAMDQYSRDFEKTFLDTLRMRHSTKEVNANNVYQQVIQDKQHIHMNATIWATLSDFVKYLGKKGKCHVKETERGWYISYIEQDVSKLARQEQLVKRQQAEQAAEQALNERIEKQRMEAAKAHDGGAGTGGVEPTKLERTDPNATVQVSLSATAKPTKKKKTARRKVSGFGGDDDDDDDEEEEEDDMDGIGAGPGIPVPPPILPPSAAAAAQKKRPLPPSGPSDSRPKKKKTEETDGDRVDDDSTTWLHRDILVRIVDRKLGGGKYFQRKAAVDRVLPPSHSGGKPKAEVTLLASGPNCDDGGDVLTLKQKHLETVVPKQVGKKVRILRGKHRGKIATVEELNKKKYRAVLELEKDGTILEKVDYDDFSKIA